MGCLMSEAALRHRIRPGGRWQPLLPGVYLSHTGTPTTRQQEMAALLYAGTGSVITGASALHQHLIRAPETAMVECWCRQSGGAGMSHLSECTARPKCPRWVFPVGQVSYAWWPGACVAAEVESREWHLAPRDRSGHGIRALPA